MMIVDGTNAVLGRLASATAKKLLSGETIKIINSESVIVTGNPTEIRKKYLRFKQIGSPQHGPFNPKRPDMIVKRCVRGMMPKTQIGRAKLKNLKVYIGNPENEKGEQIAVRQVKTDYITIGNVAKEMGWQK